MTTEEINDAIAEALGRTRESIKARRDWEEAERKFQGAEITEEEFFRTHLRVDPTPEVIPDCCNDYNSVYAAEVTLLGLELWCEFWHQLGKICGVTSFSKYNISDCHRMLHASPYYRSVALLKTLGHPV